MTSVLPTFAESLKMGLNLICSLYTINKKSVFLWCHRKKAAMIFVFALSKMGSLQ